MDENSISVHCAVPHCDGRVVGDTRCSLHGGKPLHEFRTDLWGHTTWVINRKEGDQSGNTVR